MAGERAKYGAEAAAEFQGKLPQAFPRTMGPNAAKYVQEVVESGLTASGMITRFEKAFAEKMGLKHCVATPGCTPALAILASAFNFEPGDEIIVSPITDFGTIHGLVQQNYIPVFADTEPGSVNLNADTVAACITDRTRAVLCVHKTGIVCDMDPINTLAEKHGLIVYEDACQAIFSKYKGKYAGSLGTAGGFSFDSEKTLGSDVGGCVVTDDDELAERMRFVGQSRGAAMKPGFGRQHAVNGYAYRMTQSTAAITLAQLEIIDPNVAQRDRMIRLLTTKLAEIPGITPLSIPDYLDVYSCWMAGFSIDPGAFSCDTDTFAKECADAGLTGAGTGRYYLMPPACTFLTENAANKVYPYSTPPASRSYEYNENTCPTARDFLETFVRWSTFCERYTEEHVDMATEIVRRVAEANRK
jgi:perosamine synthetase